MQKLLNLRWSGIIMYNIIIIYRLNKSQVQGDQTLPLLVWLESLMEWHYTRGYEYPEWFSSLTHFLNEQCVHLMFLWALRLLSLSWDVHYLDKKKVSVWQLNCITSDKNELSSSHGNSWRGRINAWVQISKLIQHMLTCDEEGWTVGLLYPRFKTIFVIV